MKLRKITAVFLACILLGWLSWNFLHAAEPTYHGKTFSELVSASHVGGGKSPFDDELMAGMSAMGTNAYPRLLQFVSAHDGALRTKILNLFNYQGLIRVHMRTAADKQSVAERVFYYFGTNMARAVPGLIPLTRDSDPLVRHCALNCLIAAESRKTVLLPVLTERLQDADRPTSQSAAGYVYAHYPDEARELNVSKYLRYFPPAIIMTNSLTNVTVIWVPATNR